MASAGCTSQGQFLRKAEGEISDCRSLPVEPGLATYDLALSGGGYRAMLFHVGALWRLHELGMLKDVRTISSVSGGSITAGVLALQLGGIQNDARNHNTHCFKVLVADPLVQFAQTTVDTRAVAQSLVTPLSAGNVLARYYRADLYGDAKMSDTPVSPAFVFQATNLHTGSVWSISRDLMGDPQVKYTDALDFPLSAAVAASSSFPPVLSPFILEGAERLWVDAPYDAAITNSREFFDMKERLQRQAANLAASAPPEVLATVRRRVFLTDGGVADNLAIEGIWYSKKTLLISDGGGNTEAVVKPSTNWLGQLTRITELIHAQPSQLRYRSLLDGFRAASSSQTGSSRDERDGAYWALGKPLPCHREESFGRSARVDPEVLRRLSSVPTRLAAMTQKQAEELVNLGYHVADWSIPYLEARWPRTLTADRALNTAPQISENLPYPDSPLWGKDRTQGGAGRCN